MREETHWKGSALRQFHQEIFRSEGEHHSALLISIYSFYLHHPPSRVPSMRLEYARSVYCTYVVDEHPYLPFFIIDIGPSCRFRIVVSCLNQAKIAQFFQEAAPDRDIRPDTLDMIKFRVRFIDFRRQNPDRLKIIVMNSYLMAGVEFELMK